MRMTHMHKGTMYSRAENCKRASERERELPSRPAMHPDK